MNHVPNHSPHLSADAHPAPPRTQVAARTSRLLLRRLLYGLARLWRIVRPIAGFLAIVLLLLGAMAWLAYQAFAPRMADPRSALLQPPPAVVTFLEGQRTYNAEAIWNSYSPDYQATLLQRGSSKATLQATVDRERQSGLKYSHHDYIGGVQTSQGGTMYYYSLNLERNGQRATFPLIVSVNEDGQIISLSSPDLE